MASTTQMVTLGVVLLSVAFLFPTIIDSAAGGETTSTVEVGNGSGNVAQIEDAMRVQLLSQSGDTMTLDVTLLNGNDSNEFTISQGETVTFQLDGETVTFNAIRIDSNAGGLFDVTYPVDLGWTPESSEISNNLPLVFAALPVIIVLGIAAKVVR